MKLHAPKPGTRFAVHRGRLALFHSSDDHRDYWRDYWTPAKLERMRWHLATGALDDFETVFSRYLPEDGLVLEAGCGAGFYVAALAARHYRVIGIDYEPQVIERLREAAPELEVEVGDITSTRFADGEVAAYISLGVVEHFENGCDDALGEMARIVAPGGLALLSVPYANPARRRHRQRVAPSESLPPELSFHQYYYSGKELTALLAPFGFETVELYPYGCEAFLTREQPLMRWLWRSPLMRERFKRFLRPRFQSPSKAFRRRYGHMILAVAQKVG